MERSRNDRAPSAPLLYWPPPPPPLSVIDAYKRCPQPRLTSHHPSPPPSPHLPHRSTPPLRTFGRRCRSPSPDHLPSSGERPIEFWSERKPCSSELGPPILSRSMVDTARRSPWPRGPSLREFPLQKQFQIFVISINPRDFVEKPLGFLKLTHSP
jgi:hypothetical protein